ncbi:MAG TPA: helix-turn-helix domain-containing protein [Aliidongia sp.]|nr:helix-turn-helix domain-containing protein [Aliidongia sp.]
MRRTNLSGAACPIARSLDEIGDWWTLLIVREAFRGARRFSEFEKGLGLAKNILSRRLRQLVENGILEVRAPANGGARHEYHLTEKGSRLRVVMVALRQWGEDNLFAEDEEMTVLLEKATGQPIGRLRVTSHDGRVLEPDDVVTRWRAGDVAGTA